MTGEHEPGPPAERLTDVVPPSLPDHDEGRDRALAAEAYREYRNNVVRSAERRSLPKPQLRRLLRRRVLLTSDVTGSFPTDPTDVGSPTEPSLGSEQADR